MITPDKFYLTQSLIGTNLLLFKQIQPYPQIQCPEKNEASTERL